MVSEWMLNGNVRYHVSRDPETSRLQLVGRQAQRYTGLELTQLSLLDTSHGLSFLPSLGIVHGDLKGVRISFSPAAYLRCRKVRGMDCE